MQLAAKNIFSLAQSLYKTQVDTSPLLRSNDNLQQLSSANDLTKGLLAKDLKAQTNFQVYSDVSQLFGKSITNAGLSISRPIAIRATDDKARIKAMQALRFQIDDDNYLTLSPTGANPLELRLNGVDLINTPINFDYKNNQASFAAAKFSPTSVGGAPVMVSLGRISGAKIILPNGKEKSLESFTKVNPQTGFSAVNTKPSSQAGVENICHCSTLFNEFNIDSISLQQSQSGEFQVQLSLDLSQDPFLKELLRDDVKDPQGKLTVVYSLVKNPETGRYNFVADIKLSGDVYAGATGVHLYLNADDDSKLTVPAKKYIPVNKAGEATADPQELTTSLDLQDGQILHENKDFDHTFTDLEFNAKWASSSLENKKQKIIFQQSITAPFLQVFNNSGKANTKGQKYICLEPLGGAPDAINQSSLGKNHFNPVISSKDEPFRMAYKLDAMAIKQKNIFSRFMSFCWTKIKKLFGK